MKDWAVILGVSTFKVIHEKHINRLNINGVVRFGLTPKEAIKIATELNKTLDRHAGLK